MALCVKKATSSGTETDGSEEGDWSVLPPDLIRLVSWELTDISDFVRFRVVCKRWRRAVQTSDLAPQLPWIIHNNFGSFEKGCLGFYSLLTGKTYTVNVPQINDKSVRGSEYNYLLTCNSRTRECSLFNPLTKNELSLPRAEFRFPSCLPSGLSPDQSSSERYATMSKSSSAPCTPLFYCRPGDHHWSRVETEATFFQTRECSELGEFWNSGFTFYNGRCYATDRETNLTKVIDLATQTVIHVVPQPESEPETGARYLVASFGVILRVCYYQKYSKKKPSYFLIYRLELGNRDGGDPCWVEIDNISNQFLFLHDIHGCAFRAEDFPGFVANSIYFSEENFLEKTFQFFRYDIKEKIIQVLPVPVNLGRNWFVPSLC